MKVYVIGGGAAGMVAAITASQNGHDVTILEHKDRLGKKILATGNGRCNLSNSLLEDEPGQYYRSASSGESLCTDDACGFIDRLYRGFSYNDTIEFFGKLGLCVRNKGTLMYPYSEQASAVLDVLRFRIRDLGIRVITDCHVKGILPKNGRIEISAETACDDQNRKMKYVADKVILATGSKAQSKLGADGSGYEILKGLGHTITRVSPALVQMKAAKEGKNDIFKSLAGVRCRADIELFIENRSVAKESGELQLTAYGISGIAVMNLTTYLGCSAKNVSVNVDLVPEYSVSDVEKYINNKRSQITESLSEELLIGLLPKKLGDAFLKLSGIGFSTPYSEISTAAVSKLAALLKCWKINIEGTNSYDDAQICMGGVPVCEIKDTMESVKVPGLYLAGEIIDAHGPCGGFNLQQAWSSGVVAGRLG